MGKHEAPPFRMLIQGGRLVPATPYDAERLDSYRNGMEVCVRLTEDKDRVLVRKWWAILNRAVKECSTPWKTASEASEAIKLAIGVVNLTKTVGGQFMAYPKSLTELDDPELTDAVEQMIAVVHRITGVDPEEWRRQVSHIRDEESPASSTGDGSGRDGFSSAETAAANPSGENQPVTPEEGDNPGQVTTDAAPSSVTDTSTPAECLKAFLQAATDPDLSVTERRTLLEDMKDWWKQALPSRLDFVRACLRTADKVAKGETDADTARKYLEGLL